MYSVLTGKIVALMARRSRSLQLRPEYVEIARSALKNNSSYTTQIRLGIEAEIQAQSTVSNFFRDKPVERANFNKLCQLLGIDPVEVGQEPLPSPPVAKDPDTIQRSQEESWYQKLLEPQALIRIQAPFEFGKTSLMWRLLDRANKEEKHLTLYLTLSAIESSSFQDPRTFFRRFVCEITSELDGSKYAHRLMPIDRYDEIAEKLGYVIACTKYLEYLQKHIPQPLTLGINKIDRLIDFPTIADEFLTHLRSLNEKSKQPGNWENFRLILAYSSPQIEDCIPLAHHKSPFNVGQTIELTEFSPSEVAELATKKGLTLDSAQISALMQLIGGIPSVIQLLFDDLREQNATIGENLATSSPLHQHLAMQAEWLQRRDLYLLMQEIATNSIARTDLSTEHWSLLYRQGLVVEIDRQVRSRCELYRQFFARRNPK